MIGALVIIAIMFVIATVTTSATIDMISKRRKALAGAVMLAATTLLLKTIGIAPTIALLALLLVLLGMGYVALCLFIQRLSGVDLLFTTVKEGTRKVVLTGETFEKPLMAYQGHHVNIPPEKSRFAKSYYSDRFPDWEIVYHGPGNNNGFAGEMQKDSYYDHRPALLRRLGVYWIGFPWSHKIKRRWFEWNESYVDPKTGAEALWPRADWTTFDYVQPFPYTFIVVEAETKELPRVDMTFVMTVAESNAYLPDHGGTDWLKIVTSYALAEARSFASSRTYETILDDRGKPENEFSKPLTLLTTKLKDTTLDSRKEPKDGLRGFLGIVIVSARLQTVELSGANAVQLQEAAAAAFVAEKEAAAAILKADGEASSIKIIADARAYELTAEANAVKEGGEAAELMATLNTMATVSKGAGTSQYWVNNPIGGIGDILSRVFKKGSSS
jgi:hypothetical protein